MTMRRARRGQCDKVASFASVLDPAFLASSSNLDKGKRRAKGQERAQSNGGENHAGSRRTIDFSAGQGSILTVAAQGGQALVSRVLCGVEVATAHDALADVTEPIDDTTCDLAGENFDYMRTSTGLAAALADEEAQTGRSRSDRCAKQREEVERRTQYGSAKRRMDRRSVSSIRNERPSARSDDLPKDVADAALSQGSHHSIESDDGVYKTQFSFYHFPPEQHSESQSQSQCIIREHSSCTSDPPRSASYLSGSQTGYDADRSMTLSTQQSNASGVEAQAAATRNGQGEQCVTIHRPVFNGVEERGTMHKEQDLHLIRAVNDTVQKKDGGRMRSVYPTIWRGHRDIDMHFGPLLDAFMPARRPPARADLARWADWTDSQSDSDHKTLKRTLFDDEQDHLDIAMLSSFDR